MRAVQNFGLEMLLIHECLHKFSILFDMRQPETLSGKEAPSVRAFSNFRGRVTLGNCGFVVPSPRPTISQTTKSKLHDDHRFNYRQDYRLHGGGRRPGRHPHEQ